MMMMVNMEENMSNVLARYNYDDNSGKEAIVVDKKGSYYVHILSKKGNIEKTIDVSEHSIYYAQDTAVNYATGIVKEDLQ